MGGGKIQEACAGAKESNSIVTKSSLAEGRVRPILFDLVFDLESEDL
jgi:hypothetical protein